MEYGDLGNLESSTLDFTLELEVKVRSDVPGVKWVRWRVQWRRCRSLFLDSGFGEGNGVEARQIMVRNVSYPV